MKTKLLNILAVLLFLIAAAACSNKESSHRQKILGTWKIKTVIQNENDVTARHNPFNERIITFHNDNKFISNGRPYGKNTGKWAIDETTAELYLDSDAGEGDDSYWLVAFPDQDEMHWKGTKSESTKGFGIIYVRLSKE